MSDYIKRSDALNFEWEIECEPDDLQPMMEGMVRVMDYIKQLPAADVVEVVHGEWIDDKSTIIGDLIERNCSLCGQRMTSCIERMMSYCPNCGAKMDGERKDGAE